MANCYEIIADRDVSGAEALRLAERMRVWLAKRGVIHAMPERDSLDGWIHRPGPAYQSTLSEPDPYDWTVQGLEFLVGRNVFLQMPLRLTCGACGARFKPEGEPWVRWNDAVDVWWSGDASVLYACPGCGVAERLTEWSGDAPWCFGCLGLKFWDWAPLSEQFIREVTEQLGHRTVAIRGKL
jgi:hypothetical protein